MKLKFFQICSFVFLFMTTLGSIYSQPSINNLDEISTVAGTRTHYKLKMGSDTYGWDIEVPVIVIQGSRPGPTLGLIAAIHGDELNGISVIHKSLEKIDPKIVKGRIIAIPGINAESIKQDRRRFIDDEDLNRNFPGKASGNRSQQYAHKIIQRVTDHMDYIIDMHTASFGRINCMYVRADMTDDTIAKMAMLQNADIILNNKGIPSANEAISATRTMRAEAVMKGTPTITIEYGNPQVYQEDMVSRGMEGLLNTLLWLGMYDSRRPELSLIKTIFCRKSYWIFMEEGGFLEVIVDIKEMVSKGQKIAIVRNGFGEIIKEYFCPEEGIVIGKSTNPTNMSGGRIIHLGLIE